MSPAPDGPHRPDDTCPSVPASKGCFSDPEVPGLWGVTNSAACVPQPGPRHTLSSPSPTLIHSGIYLLSTCSAPGLVLTAGRQTARQNPSPGGQWGGGDRYLHARGTWGRNGGGQTGGPGPGTGLDVSENPLWRWRLGAGGGSRRGFPLTLPADEGGEVRQEGSRGARGGG